MNREIKFRQYYYGEFHYGGILAEKSWTSFPSLIFDLHPLCQYTGLKDKNGVEIYEGDVLQHPDKVCFQVIWDDCMCSFRAKYDDKSGSFMINNQIGEKGLALVIGNIYENPELLEGE